MTQSNPSPSPKTATPFFVLAALLVVGGVLSGILLFEHFGVRAAGVAVEELCGPDDESGCDDVAASDYATVGGVSLAGIGVAFYLSLLLLSGVSLSASDTHRNVLGALALALVGLAVAMDVALFLVQTFAIGAYCSLCVGTYAVNAASLAVMWPFRSALGQLTTQLATAGGARTVASVWLIGSILVVGSVLSVEHALGSLRKDSAVTLLGEPPGNASMASTSAEETADEGRVDGAEEVDAWDTDESIGSDEELSADQTLEALGREALESEEPRVAEAPGEEAASEIATRLQSLETQLARARAENEGLRETLDDPQKYQEYQMERATREFENAEAKEIALDGIPFKGPEDAPIQVVEYSDFLCPFCRNLAGALANFMPQSGGRVAVFYKNYPLDQACNPSLSRTVHDGACELALGAICAQEQGNFWAYHDAVFTEPPHNPTNDDVVRLAASAGLDGDTMRGCLTSDGTARKLTAEIEEAKRLEVSSTPTVFVNGKRLEQIGGFMMAIESEATRLGLGSN